jgi:hypothetical protein
MKIKWGKIYYKLVIEKETGTKRGLLEFIKTKTTDMAEINRIDGIDFDNSQTIYTQLQDIKLDISIKPTEIILLFHTQLSNDQFEQYIRGWFQ